MDLLGDSVDFWGRKSNILGHAKIRGDMIAIASTASLPPAKLECLLVHGSAENMDRADFLCAALITKEGNTRGGSEINTE